MNRLAPYASVLGGNAAARPAGLQAGGVAGNPAAYLDQYMTTFRGKMGQPGRINPPGGGTPTAWTPGQPGMGVGAPSAPVPGGVGQMPGGGPVAGGTPRAGTMPPGQEFLGGSAPNPAAVSTMAPGAAMGGFGAPSPGLAGAEQAYQAALAGGLGLLQQGTAQGRSDLMQAGAGANQTLNTYYNPGFRANDYQAALSGALGNAAQQKAMEGFMGSPGQQYLLNESERAIKRNAAATGGLGGGNVQRALQENAIGLAAQDFDNAFNRLGTISDRGLAAGGQISGNTMSTGQQLANLTSNNARAGADLVFGTGAQLGAGRTRAGEAIAGNVQTTGSNLADIMYGTGRDMSNVIGAGGSNLAEILRNSGRDNQVANAQLAEILARISSNQGSQFAGLPGLGQTQQTTGLLSNLVGGSDDLARILAMIGTSDARLKTNIRRVGTVGGVNLYSWDWTDEGAALAGDEATVGVLAQEHPHASLVGPHGYLMVDYSRVW